ncbi:hypothetical protein CD201_12665 [Hafnia alvei]|nr:hypothetical protein CD201_12665 [Hafnia alvei]
MFSIVAADSEYKCSDYDVRELGNNLLVSGITFIALNDSISFRQKCSYQSILNIFMEPEAEQIENQ